MTIQFNWQDFLTNPFLGSGRGGYLEPHDIPVVIRTGGGRLEDERRSGLTRRGGADPSPWILEFLVSAVSSKEAASEMKNQEAAQQIRSAADTAISEFLDDYCGTPWPFPGPPPWVSATASQLTWAAYNLQAGGLRTGLLQLVGQMLDRVALNPQPLPPVGAG